MFQKGLEMFRFPVEKSSLYFPNVKMVAVLATNPTNRKIMFHSSHGIPGISNRNIWSYGKRLWTPSRRFLACRRNNVQGVENR